MSANPTRTEPNRILEFLGSIDADFGYATGNLNMDTTPENRKEIIAALHRLILKERREERELCFDNIGGEDIKVRAWVARRKQVLPNLDAEIEGSNKNG